MPEPALIRQRVVGENLAEVTVQLTDAFTAMRGAVQAGRPVVVLLDDRDLLGQRSVGDAAVATGLLGLVRALALEGAREGWQVNAVSHRDDAEPVAPALAALAGAPGLTGQLLRCGSEHLGKVLP